jgi:hypothetical protein
MEKIRILILAANPWETDRLDLGEEYQRIQDLWEDSKLQGRFDLRYYPASRGEKLQEKVLKFKPHIIHFSGHGGADGLIFTDPTGDKAHEVSKPALAELFRLCAPDLKVVFLNACYSANQAEEIIKQVDYVIGMNAAIIDSAAIDFSQGFYTSIFNRDTLDIDHAFATGRNQMKIIHTPEAEQKKPVLRRRTFVPSYQHDIFISFANGDNAWSNNLIASLEDQIKKKLATADSFQLYKDNDFNQLDQSAILLIVLSDAYNNEYQEHSEQLKSKTKQKPLFLIEYKPTERPKYLQGKFDEYLFWGRDNLQGVKELNGKDYSNKVNELAKAVVEKLKELKSKQTSHISHSESPVKKGSKIKFSIKNGVIVCVKIQNYDELSKCVQENIQQYLQGEILSSGYLFEFSRKNFTFVIEGEETTYLIDQALKFYIHINKYFKKAGVIFGIVIHKGEFKFSYIENETNRHISLLGSEIDHALILLSFSNKSHILVSDQIVQELGKDDLKKKLKKLLCKKNNSIEITLETKIIKQHTCHNIFARNKGKLITGDNSNLQERVLIEYRSEQGTPLEQNTFVKKLQDCDKVWIIGVTNENIVNFLNEALNNRKENTGNDKKYWKELNIIFPSLEILNKIVDQNNSEERRLNREKGIRSISVFFKTNRDDFSNFGCNWSIKEYDGNFPFIGQKFFYNTDSSDNTFSIRVAPVLLCDLKKSYYMEVYQGNVFNLLNKSFEIIQEKSHEIQITEWYLLGKVELEELKKIKESKQYCPINMAQVKFNGITHWTKLPNNMIGIIALIVLYSISPTKGNCIILQMRTSDNSSDSHNKYSNITGRVNDEDLLIAAGIEQSTLEKYKKHNHCVTNNPDDNTATQALDEALDSILSFDRELLKNGKLLEQACFIAAQREIKEEIDLDIKLEDLQKWDAGLSETNSRLFQIFSLYIKLDQFDYINKKYPDTFKNLDSSGFNKIDKSQLNNFLCQEFEYFNDLVFKKIKK